MANSQSQWAWPLLLLCNWRRECWVDPNYQQWLDGLPESLADALRAVYDLDLSGLELDLSHGFGRD